MDKLLCRIPLSALRTFEAAARHLSFTKAAKDLHLTQGAVSQQISHLEDRLGFELFHRKVRGLELSAKGKELSTVVRNALSEIDETVKRLQAGESEGVLTVSLGSAFAMNWLIPRLGDFRDQYPNIDVRIHAVDDAIDFRTEQGRDIDLMIRFSRGNYPELHVTELMKERVFVVCSPSLLDSRRLVRKPSDLCQYPLLHNEVSEREPDSAGDWSNWLRQLGEPVLPCIERGPRFPRCDMLIQAALHGQGMALVWDTMVGNELRIGRLVKPLQGRFETTNAFYAVSAMDAAQRPKVRKFREWLLAQVRSETDRADSTYRERQVSLPSRS